MCVRSPLNAASHSATPDAFPCIARLMPGACPRRTLAVLSWWCLTASLSGVFPFESLAVMSALFSSRNLTSSSRPSHAATCSAVRFEFGSTSVTCPPHAVSEPNSALLSRCHLKTEQQMTQPDASHGGTLEASPTHLVSVEKVRGQRFGRTEHGLVLALGFERRDLVFPLPRPFPCHLLHHILSIPPQVTTALTALSPSITLGDDGRKCDGDGETLDRKRRASAHAVVGASLGGAGRDAAVVVVGARTRGARRARHLR
eukprot:1233218-Rhodomonas_salina.1